MDDVIDTYLPDILHGISDSLLVPTMAAILVMLALVLFFIGQTIVEYFTERRRYRQNVARIVNDIVKADYGEIETVVAESKLLRQQKSQLILVARNMGLPEEPLFALAQISINAADRSYRRRLAWTETLSKVGPMLGLMATLIPLGPGIVALGNDDIETLSSALLVAFDATVCGLIAALVSIILSRVRSGWYTEYVTTLESLMSCVIDKASEARGKGIELPADYAGDPILEYDAVMRKKKGAVLRSDAKGAASSASSGGNAGDVADGEGGEAEAKGAASNVVADGEKKDAAGRDGARARAGEEGPAGKGGE